MAGVMATPENMPPKSPRNDAAPPRRYVDIGANLTDKMFQGEYHGKRYHAPDLHRVLQRAKKTGLEIIIVTAGTLEESEDAVRLVKRFDTGKSISGGGTGTGNNTDSALPTYPRLFTTVGAHPTRCDVFQNSGDPEGYFGKLLARATERSYLLSKDNLSSKGAHDDANDAVTSTGPIVAIGECGLDYDRLEFCGKNTQLVWFERQFELSRVTKLPMFLHSRGAHGDFFSILKKHRVAAETAGDPLPPCVVHSFDGTCEELNDFLTLEGVYIGINGCSLRTETSLDVVKHVPPEKLMVETDAPWCSIKNTHPGAAFVDTKWQSKDKKKIYKELEKFDLDEVEKEELDASLENVTVKDRSEPCHVAQVVEVLARVRGEDPHVLAETCRENTMKVFFPFGV